MKYPRTLSKLVNEISNITQTACYEIIKQYDKTLTWEQFQVKVLVELNKMKGNK